MNKHKKYDGTFKNFLFKIIYIYNIVTYNILYYISHITCKRSGYKNCKKKKKKKHRKYHHCIL